MPTVHFISLESFRNEAVEWRRFLKAVILSVGIPFCIALLFCELLSWKTGEFIPDRVAAERQITNPQLVWFAHNERDSVHFKLIRVDQERPQILVMGQSRMGQFRSAMFAPYSFYNSSRVSWPLGMLPQVLSHLPAGYSPKVIFFNIDFFLFNWTYDASHVDALPRFESAVWRLHLHSLRDAFNVFLEHPELLRSSNPFPTIGLEAYTLHRGFRKDGSEVWPRERLRSGPDILKSVQWNLDPLNFHNNVMGVQQMGELEEFAAMAKARGISLVGIQMPLYGPLLREMGETGRYGIVQDTKAHFSNGYFDRLGIIAFDYLSFPPYTEDYHYFIDPIHPSEVLCGAVALKIAQDPRVRALLPKLDTSALHRVLEENQKADQHLHLY